jgi:hypothetical protein
VTGIEHNDERVAMAAGRGVCLEWGKDRGQQKEGEETGTTHENGR